MIETFANAKARMVIRLWMIETFANAHARMVIRLWMIQTFANANACMVIRLWNIRECGCTYDTYGNKTVNVCGRISTFLSSTLDERDGNSCRSFFFFFCSESSHSEALHSSSHNHIPSSSSIHQKKKKKIRQIHQVVISSLWSESPFVCICMKICIDRLIRCVFFACRGIRSNLDDDKMDEEPSVSDFKSALGINREDETLRYFSLLSSSSSFSSWIEEQFPSFFPAGLGFHHSRAMAALRMWRKRINSWTL